MPNALNGIIIAYEHTEYGWASDKTTCDEVFLGNINNLH